MMDSDEIQGAPGAPFLPEADARAFRNALGAFATGVTVVTTDTPEGPVAIVANSFASVSLDPPLVLWSPAKASRRHAHFAHAARFAIHVLAEDQMSICDAFNRSKTAFEGIDWTTGPSGVPLIAGTAACFECNFEAGHDAGDHTIIVGRVIRAHATGAEPLIFHGGRFGAFRDLPEA